MALLVAVACGGAAAREQPRDAPGRYRVPADLGRLVVDAAAFAGFARAVRRDLEAEADTGGLAARKERLFLLSLLDALDDRWSSAVTRIDRIAAMETDPMAKSMTGLTIRVWADARAHGGDTPAAFHAALERRLAAMDLAAVRGPLSVLRAMGQTFTPDVCRQLVVSEIAPRVQGGTVGVSELHAILFQRYAAVRLAPVGPVIDEVLGARGIEPPPE